MCMCSADEVTAKETSSSYFLKLSVTISGAVLLIGVLAFAVIYLMRRSHHKRLLATRNKQDPETYYAGDDFRATAAGDSTLRVRIGESRCIRRMESNGIICRSICNTR